MRNGLKRLFHWHSTGWHSAWRCFPVLPGWLVLYPRTLTGGTGSIFWEDIQAKASSSQYYDQLRSLDKAAVEREYASQNYYASKVLHAKYEKVRLSMGAFYLSCRGLEHA
ncbi:Pycsar system effector family protein [Nitrospira sp. Nam74]